MSFKTTLFGFALAGLLAMQAEARSMTVYNNCPFTIWPGIFTGNTANGSPDGVASQGGWQLNSYGTSKFNVPDSWTAGRIWGRTECDFSKQDVQACATGSCIGGLHCTQPGIPPVTLAEFTLNANGLDNYDVSAVDGTNLPTTITANGCTTASCPVDLNPNCPAELQYKNANGVTVGCYSSCKKLGGESNCCTGAHDTAATCPPSGVQYYDYFKNACPQAYAYAYDEASGALKTCNGANLPEYTITFCP